MFNIWLQRIAGWVLGREDARALFNEMEELYLHRVEREGEAAANQRRKRRDLSTLKHLLAAGLRRGSFNRKGNSPGQKGWRWTPGLRTQLRSLARSPVFAICIVGTFALGLGGITAVFSVVHGVLLNPLPYPEPQELVQISNSARGNQWPLSAVDFLAIEEQQTRFDDVEAISWTRVTYSRESGSDRMLVHVVTPGLLPLLGIQAAYGRVFLEEERDVGAAPVALLGWEFWNREFGGDPDFLGKTIRVDGDEVPVVGILPARVGPSLEGADIIFPLQLAPPQRKGPFFLNVLGRLGDGVAPEAAAAELAAINERIFPIWIDSWSDQEATWLMTDLKTQVVGNVGSSILVIMGAAAFLLLMVCANAASLMLARMLDRRRELAVRAALGASPKTLVFQLMAESGVLVFLGSLGGLGLAILGIRLTATLGAPFIPRSSEVALTGPVLLFALAMAVGSLVLFGLLPALRAPSTRVVEGMREGGPRVGASAWTRRARSLLVTTQFAVSLPVLIGGGLMVASFLSLMRVDPGFDADRVLALDVALPADVQRTNRELAQIWDQLLREIRSLPGVEEAGIGQGRPPEEYPFTNNFVLEDQPVAEGETQPSVPWIFASKAYFDALGSRLVAGQMFEPQADDGAFVVLVDEAFARRFYAGAEDALGRRFLSGGCTGDDCPGGTIIGVMEAVRYTGLEGSSPGVIFVNSQAFPSANSSLVVRAREGVDPSTLAALVRGSVWRLDSRAAISRVATGEELLSRNLRVPRYLAALMGSFGALSVLLAIIGIYGVMDYFVRQHRRDMGIRIALGGHPAHVLWLVLNRGMVLVVVGLGIGLVAALLMTRFLASLLHGIGPTDPRIVLGAMSLMGLVAVLACWGPARRASNVSPREVLVEE